MLYRPSRLEEKATRVPSGNQTGSWSAEGSKINRVGTPRSRSISQISGALPAGSIRLTAARVPSADRSTDMSTYDPAGPAGPEDLPSRSNQVNRLVWPP